MPRVEIDGVLYVPVTEIAGIELIAKAILRATHFADTVDDPGFDYKEHLAMDVVVDYGVRESYPVTLEEVLAAIVEEKSA